MTEEAGPSTVARTARITLSYRSAGRLDGLAAGYGIVAVFRDGRRAADEGRLRCRDEEVHP